jgi:hypothetical protein
MADGRKVDHSPVQSQGTEIGPFQRPLETSAASRGSTYLFLRENFLLVLQGDYERLP